MSELEFYAVVTDRHRFSVAPGEVLTLLGPNGMGKSTALDVIAGLTCSDEDLVRLGTGC